MRTKNADASPTGFGICKTFRTLRAGPKKIGRCLFWAVRVLERIRGEKEGREELFERV
jgi:hypothetical protein